MIRWGKLCKTCTAGECREDLNGIEIECPSCRGRGCDRCQAGQFVMQECPNKYCREMVDVVELFDLFQQGIPPITGGALDQAAWFVHASRVFRSEESLAKAVENE